MTVSAPYAALVREARLANTGQPCGDGFIAGGLQCHVGVGDAQRGGRRTPERQARMRELQLQIKRERNLPPNAAAGLTPEQLHHVRRLATRRETDENIRRQAAGQAQRPAIQRPAAQPTADEIAAQRQAANVQREAGVAARAAQLEADHAAAMAVGAGQSPAEAAAAGAETAARLEARRQAIEVTERAAREADARAAASQPAVSASPSLDAAMAATIPAAAVVAAAQPESRPVVVRNGIPEVPPRYDSAAARLSSPINAAAIDAILPLAQAGNYNAISDLQLHPDVAGPIRDWRQQVISHLRANDNFRQLRIAGLPSAPVFEAASAPMSLAHVTAVQAAVSTGNVAAVRSIVPASDVNENARQWQHDVVAFMERQQMEAAVAAAPPVQAQAAPAVQSLPPPPERYESAATRSSNPRSVQALDAIRAAVATGNVQAVRDVRIDGFANDDVRNWHRAVISHMEQNPTAAPAPAAVAPLPYPEPPNNWRDAPNSRRAVPEIQAAIVANDLAAVRAVDSQHAYSSVQEWHQDVIRRMEAQANPAIAVAPPAPPASYSEVHTRLNNPVSARTLDAIQAAMLSGNVQAVRDVPSGDANRDVQNWQRDVIAHMEARNAQSVRPFATPPAAPVAPVVPAQFPREPYIQPGHAGAQRYLGSIQAALASGSASRIRNLRMAGSDASRGQYARLRRYHQQLIDHVNAHGASPRGQAQQAQASPQAAPVAIPASMPALPPIPADRAGRADDYPHTRAFVARVSEAIATGDLVAVRAAGVGQGEPLAAHREWHNQVMAHMEQAAREAALTPEARARAAEAAERARVRDSEMQARLNQVHPVVVPPPRILSTEEQANLDRIAADRRALDSRVAAKREAATVAEREAMARHAPAVTAAEAATREAAAALERANAAHRSALQARGDEVNPAREAGQRAEALRVSETRRLEREAASAAVGKHRQTLTAADGKVIYKPSDFVPSNTPGHNANYVEDNSVAINAGRLATTFGVPQTEVNEKVKSTVLSMMSDLPEKVGSQTGKWTVKVKSGGDGSLDVSFSHPGMSSAISRTFSNGSSGLQVYHGYFAAGDSKGEGLSQKLFKQSIGAYERAGVKEIKVYAALSHGGYVWLRHGFVPDPGDDDSYRSIARSTLTRLRTQGANLANDGRHTKPDTAEKVAKIDADEKTGVLTKDEAVRRRGSLINSEAIYNYKTDKIPLPGTRISQEAYDAYLKLVDSGDPRDIVRLASIKYGDIKIGAEMFVGRSYHGTIRMDTGDLDRTKEYIMRNRKPV